VGCVVITHPLQESFFQPPFFLFGYHTPTPAIIFPVLLSHTHSSNHFSSLPFFLFGYHTPTPAIIFPGFHLACYQAAFL
jgi:uncharacterized PurR-regulated membrane protein YhhQ (DUF165 family)